MAGVLENRKIFIHNGEIWTPRGFETGDILISGNKIAEMAESLAQPEECEVIEASGMRVLPGLVDAHVHFREPGYGYKETILSGSQAAAHGGFTIVFTMPNLNPVPDDKENILRQWEIIRKDACIEVIPFASITRGRSGKELVDYQAIAPYCIGFSDDGSGVQDAEVMKWAMREIAKTGKVLAAHCEVDSLLKGGYIHDGKYARAHGHRGICSESEWREVERDIKLARITGCKLHICHVSTKESVELVRRAKRDGLNVTCETGAHYLAFSDADLQENGRFKMNPPLRDISDKEALLEGLSDGTIDIIASDHAPHSEEEKSRGLEKSAMGVSGIELSMAAVYTYAVKPGHISMERMIDAMAVRPRSIFGLKCGDIAPRTDADITIVNLDSKKEVKPSEFLSKGKSTPFDGRELWGDVYATISQGKIAYHG